MSILKFQEYVGVATNIDRLGYDVLVHLFSYLNADEVLTNVSRVCRYWNEATRSKYLRRNLVYKPDSSKSDREIRTLISSAKDLSKFIFTRERNYDKIMRDVLNSCPMVTCISLKGKRELADELISSLLDKYKNIDIFETYYKPLEIHVDYARFKSTRHAYKTFGGIEYIVSIDDIMEVYVDIGTEIETISISCIVTSEIFSLICQFSELKYLFLQNKVETNCGIDINDLHLLQKLETLQLLQFPGDGDIESIPLSDERLLPKLTKLEILETGKSIRANINILLKICPRLKHLNLNNNELQTEDLTNITMCPGLEFLDVSNNESLGGQFLRLVGQSCPKLKFIDITGCSIPENFVLLLRNCQELETIRVEGLDLQGTHFPILPVIFPKLYFISILHFDDPDTLDEMLTMNPLIRIELCSNDYLLCSDNH